MLRSFVVTIFAIGVCTLVLATAQMAKAELLLVDKLVAAALERTQHDVTYDGSYKKIAYPSGDVPNHLGVCSDVIIRSFRAVGIDLQKEVHEDMAKNFDLYPDNWGLSRPDTNIDHRRVPNLRVFFRRHGQELPISLEVENYLPGDIVTWNIKEPGYMPHIGIITDQKTAEGVPLVVHNAGWGTRLEDMLFNYKITGHYRYPVHKK